MIKDIKPFGLRMPPKLKQAVEIAAKKNKRSLNAEIVARLEKSFGPAFSGESEEKGPAASRYGGENLQLVMDAMALTEELLDRTGAEMTAEERADFVGLIIELLQTYGSRKEVKERIENIVSMSKYLKKAQ